MKAIPILPTDPFSYFVAKRVENHLPDTWLHIYRMGGYHSRGKYNPQQLMIEPCPRDKCKRKICQRAGDWLITHEDMDLEFKREIAERIRRRQEAGK